MADDKRGKRRMTRRKGIRREKGCKLKEYGEEEQKDDEKSNDEENLREQNQNKNRKHDKYVVVVVDKGTEG